MPGHTHIKNDTINLKKLINLNINLRYWKDIAKVLFGYFGYAWLCTPKVILSTCRKLLCWPAGKKETSLHVFCPSLPIDMHTYYFGNFGQAWLCTAKTIVSTCRKLWCLSQSQKYTSSFPSFSRYYILKNPAIWEPEFCQIWDWWWNINNISLHFRLFSGKTNDKIFQKNQQKLYFVAILGLFCPNLGKYEFSWKIGPCQFLELQLCTILQKIRKNYWPIPEKNAELTDWQTDRQTDRQRWFYRILCRIGLQQTKQNKKEIIICLTD